MHLGYYQYAADEISTVRAMFPRVVIKTHVSTSNRNLIGITAYRKLIQETLDKAECGMKNFRISIASVARNAVNFSTCHFGERRIVKLQFLFL